MGLRCAGGPRRGQQVVPWALAADWLGEQPAGSPHIPPGTPAAARPLPEALVAGDVGQMEQRQNRADTTGRLCEPVVFEIM